MKDRKGKKMNNHAISESIGFIIIFGIMLTGIGLVTLYGYPMLLAEQQNANVKNMERNMIVLQNDLNALTYKNVPFEETTLQVAGGTLSVLKEPGIDGLNSSFIVEKDGVPLLEPFYPGEIHYDSQDLTATISLENGAVNLIYWSSETGSVMISEPRWFYDEPTKTFVLSLVKINASDPLSQTGIGTVRMKLIPGDQPDPIDVSGSVVEIHYIADPEYNYKVAWSNYFNISSLNEVMIQDTPSPGSSLTYHLNNSLVKTLVIKSYNVTVLSL